MKKGFTLIELLAVIVILAIIAVIAVPIVISIIEDSKKNSNLRSAQFYLDAVEMSVANATLKEKNITDGIYNIKNGNVCLNKTCTQILEIEVNGEVPKEGTITIANGNVVDIDFNISEKRIVKNDKGEIIYFPCTLISGEANTIGSKYECEVKPGVKYNFYVLSYNDENNVSTNDKTKAVTTNLIMNQNINSAGTVDGVTETETDIVAWNNETGEGTNAYGPVTAMNFLYNATKDWINIPALNYIYNDSEYQSIATDNTNTGYISFVVKNGEATIKLKTDVTTTIGTVEEPLRVRMPIYSGVWNNDYSGKITEKGEVADKKEDNSNAFLYENVKSTAETPPYGYWTLSSNVSNNRTAWMVRYGGITTTGTGTNSSLYGVRPVINIKL